MEVRDSGVQVVFKYNKDKYDMVNSLLVPRIDPGYYIHIYPHTTLEDIEQGWNYIQQYAKETVATELVSSEVG